MNSKKSFRSDARGQMSKVRKRPIAVFDIDGTIFRNSLLIELHWKMVKEGIIPRATIKRLDNLYWAWVRRQGGYEEYLEEVIKSFEKSIVGKPIVTIQRLARHVVKIQSHIVYRYTRDLIKKFRKTHILVAISGSPIEIVKAFAKKWEFQHIVGTCYAFSGRRFISGEPIVPAHDKKRALLELCEKENFTLANSVGVGDTESDIGIFELVEKPICFNPTSGLYQIARRKKWQVVVERKDVIYKLR